MKKIVSIIFFVIGVLVFCALYTNIAWAWDFSTPETTLETIEREYFDNESFDLYENTTYYSPALIKLIEEEGMSLQDYRKCGIKILKNNYIELKDNMGIDNYIFDHLDITDKKVIDDSHVYLRYKVYFRDQDDYADKLHESGEGYGYFVKFNDEWWLDFEPEIRDVLKEDPDAKMCPAEQRRAIVLEKRLGYDVLWASEDGVRASFLADGFIFTGGFWNDKYDHFGVSLFGDPTNTVRYSFTVRDLMSPRSYNDAGLKAELDKRINYFFEIIRIFESAQYDYYDVKTYQVPEIMFNFSSLDKRVIKKELSREYLLGEERIEDHPIYKNERPVIVTVNLDKGTIYEEYNQAEKQRYEESKKRDKRDVLFAPFLKIKRNPLKLLALFLAQLLMGYVFFAGYWRLFKIENIFKKKYNLTVLVFAFVRTVLYLVFVLCYVEVVVWGLSILGLSLGWPFGLLYGMIFFPIFVDVITGIVVLLILKYYIKSKWWQAFLAALVYSMVSFYLAGFINIYFI
ncbi:hypothetical protein DRH27_05275, partial [Candidatus Falkowbacteria bacterium]